MKNRHRFLLLTLLYQHSVSAAKIETDLFSIDVPDQWRVEDDKSSTILVMGDRILDQTPMPFLGIQYCAQTDLLGAEVKPCNEPCSEKSLDFLTSEQFGDLTFSAVVKHMKKGGIVEYSTEAVSPILRSTMFAAQSCSNAGQVYVFLVSDQSNEDAKSVFESVIGSIKWKN